MRNVFVSYSHRLDQDVVDEFRRKFGNDKMVFSDCSLENKDLSHLSDDTIKNNYIRPQLRLSSVTIVLIGAETGGRWWVDWEIYFSLRKSAGNERNGILGILIPNKQHYIPQRILDNLYKNKPHIRIKLKQNKLIGFRDIKSLSDNEPNTI